MMRDNGMVQESKYVSGLHVERVFSEDTRLHREFCDKYELVPTGAAMGNFWQM